MARPSKPIAAVPGSPGEIAPERLYTLTEVSRRLRVQDTWLRSQRRKGLAVLRAGGRGFVLGADLIAHLQRVGSEGGEP